MARGWPCFSCRAKNDANAEVCENCGIAKPDPKARESREASKPRQCEVDGGQVDARGFCSIGNGFVATAACPFACPLCRQHLTWDGRCFSCFGCSTGTREDWTIPGDRYELQKGHWYLVEKGPKTACTFEQNTEALKIVMAVVEGSLSEGQGQEMIELVLS